MLLPFPTANKALLNILVYHYDKMGRENLMPELVKYALVLQDCLKSEYY